MEKNSLKTGIKIMIIPKLLIIDVYIIEKMKVKGKVYFAMH